MGRVSNDLVDEIGDDINQDEQDYAFLNNNNMIQVVSNKWNSNTTNEAFIDQRIKRILKSLKIRDELAPDEVQFFSNYSSYCSDIKLVSSLRVRIVKQEGNSQFIANEFGIETFLA